MLNFLFSGEIISFLEGYGLILVFGGKIKHKSLKISQLKPYHREERMSEQPKKVDFQPKAAENLPDSEEKVFCLQAIPRL